MLLFGLSGLGWVGFNILIETQSSTAGRGVLGLSAVALAALAVGWSRLRAAFVPPFRRPQDGPDDRSAE